MAKPQKTVEVVADPTTMKVEKPADYLARGWLYLSRKKYDLAEADFRSVLGSTPKDIEALFGLGLTLKGIGRTQEAVAAFEVALNEAYGLEDRQRSSILTRLLKGHINQIKTGDWQLEKEVWQRVNG